jgi:SAM-dependent methyltransferase
MDKKFEGKCHDIEERYWWFLARRDMISRIVSAYDKRSKILDIGCSSGALIEVLKMKGYGDICGIDISEKAIGLCRKRGAESAFVMDGTDLGFEDGEFDIVITSDVLEHIEEDSLALAEWNRVLKPGGKLIVFAPALRFLWSEHDEVNHHRRRYSAPELVRLLKAANFRVCRSSYWNLSLFFPASLVRIFQRIFFGRRRVKKDQFYNVNPVFNMLLTKLLVFENRICAKTGFPFGVSVYAIAAKVP